MLNIYTSFKIHTERYRIVSQIHNFRFNFPIRTSDWNNKSIWIYATISTDVSHLELKNQAACLKHHQVIIIIKKTITFLNGHLYFGCIHDMNEDQAVSVPANILQNFLVLNSAK